jgi:hypothetical protein
MFNALPNLMKGAAIVAPKHHIFLLGHMRGYTSLFGHIMGSNPAICGYYEMHIGYYGWKSLIRQKLLYFEQETPKPGFRCMFDKILHNDHHISPNVLNSNQASTIFSLRRPQEVIPSILSLYNRIDPSHEFNSESFATRYYVSRLDELENIAQQLERGFFYLDAEALNYCPDKCLPILSNWLNLDTPLSTTYEVQKKTAKEHYGDTSDRIARGQITRQKSDYVNFQFDDGLMEMAASTYARVRGVLLSISEHHGICDLETEISAT